MCDTVLGICEKENTYCDPIDWGQSAPGICVNCPQHAAECNFALNPENCISACRLEGKNRNNLHFRTINFKNLYLV